MQKELIYCGVFLLSPFRPSAGQNASNTGWGGGNILSILPLLPSHKNTFECSDPGRPLMPTPFLPRLDPQDVTDTIRT